MRATLMLLFVLGVGLYAANAQTITVSTNIDEVDGNTSSIAALIGTPGGTGISLREAIIATNNEPGTATITINVPAGDYQLTLTGAGENLAATGDLDLNVGVVGEMKTVNIIGAGIISSHITGMGDRIFDIHPIVTGGSITFNMTGMFLSNGILAVGSGGAILAGRPGDFTTLTGCIFSNNQAQTNGGAISQSSGAAAHDLTIISCSFASNIALTGAGGAINYSGIGNVSITNTRFAQNTAGTQGGAVNLTGTGTGPALCTLTENTFVQNTANGATYGGAAIAMVNVVSVTANYNRIVLNNGPAVASGKMISTGGGTVGSMNFNNNWWGTNAGPSGATDILGTLPTEWMQLKNTGSPASICNIGSASTVTASFLSNNLDNPIAVADLDAVIGGPVNFQNPVNGTLSGAQTSIQPSGNATVTFTATAIGNGTVEARYFGTEENFISITNPAITVVEPPTISLGGQPANTAVCPGAATSFTVTAIGGGLTYQWRKGVTVLSNGVQGSGSTFTGVNTATLSISNAQAGDVAADYNVVVSNTCSSITSANAALSLNAAPMVVTDPMNSTIGNGGSTSFTATFSGTPTPTLLWEVSTTGSGGPWIPLTNAAPYSGVTTGTLTINPVTLAMDGYYYHCVATNSCSPAATTSAALLTVTPGPTSSVLSATGVTTICNGASTTLAVTITGGTSPYTVVLNAAPGGNFTIPNYISGTNIPVSPTATTTYSIVSVTDALANIGTGNSGTPMITVNPTPNAVATPASQTICSANPITTIVLSGAVGGTTYAWTRDNTVAVTGIAGSGSGNISGTLTNTTSAPVTVTFTITPTANGCPGPTTTATVIVNPIPDVNQPANQIVCNGAATALVSFTGSVPGTNYTWTNTNPSIGLPASGIGDIASFTAMNSGAAPVVANITVTPSTSTGGGPATQTFSNTGNILIPATGTSGPAGPYPSDINVTGVSGTVTKVVVKLNGIQHTFPDDIDMLLVGPAGQNAIIMSDVGGGSDITGVNLVLDDAAANNLPNSTILISGTYKPTNIGTGDIFDPPAPIPSGNVDLSIFNGTIANGIWSLYIDDDAGGDFGAMVNGWELVITSTGGGVICTGTSKTFTYTVNPTPNAVATPLSQTICNNTAITTIVLSGSVGGTTYAWTRNNTATVTGIAANGNTNISGTLNNTTNAPVTVTFTITPTANGCTGPTTTATVIVAPTPMVDPVANQTVCNGTLTAPVNFTGPVAGTIYNWTNSTPSIGLAASGTGNIAAFTGTNTTTLPVTGTITVTPTVVVQSNNVPELFHYKFDGTGTSVPNQASAPPAGTATATILGSQTQGGSGICNGTLIGSGNSSTTNYVNTNWATNLTGTSWSLSFKTSNIQPSTTLFYIFGDNTANSFRCFTNGVAGSNNWMLRGPVGDIIVPGGATVATHTTTFVYDNVAGQLRGYLDGVLVVTNAQTPPTISGTGPFKVGGYSGSTGLPAGGLMDEFRLYNRALSLTEIQELANGCAGGTAICTGPTRTFTITVNPTPTITCPANITVPSVVGACTAVVTYAPTVTGTPTPTLSYVFTGATTGSGAGTGSGTAFRVGVTTVTITATNICATVSCSFTVTVTDSQLPVITTAPANRTVCTGTNATFSVTAITAPSAGGPLSYQWQLWNGSTWNNIAGATASSYTVNGATLAMNTNSYRVVVTGLCTVVNSTHATLYVNPLPTINLTTSIPPNLLPTQVLTITATVAPGGGSFVWFKNGSVIAGASGPSLANLTVSDIGTYRVVYTGPNGCVITSSDVVITGQASDNLYVYPVPNNGQFNVRFYNQTNELVTLRVIDAKGAEVYRKKVQTTIPYTTMNVDLTTNRIFSSGVYIVEIRGADGRRVGARRIIVNKQ